MRKHLVVAEHSMLLAEAEVKGFMCLLFTQQHASHLSAASANHWACCADCPGFVQQHEVSGGNKNVAYFQQMLQKHNSMAGDKTSVAWWLTKQAPKVSQQLCPGISCKHGPYCSIKSSAAKA